MKSKRKEQILIMVEGAIMVALATVLSLCKIIEYPWGGSVTLLSMLPICLYAIRRGIKSGFAASSVYALMQLIFGLTMGGVLGWGLTPASLIGCLLLDYILPFTLLGTAACFRKAGMKGWLSGVTLALLLRLVCHFLSGVVIFASAGMVMNIQIENPYLYSLAYNSMYMVPELIFTLIATGILLGVPQFKKLLLQRGIPAEQRIIGE